MCGIAGIIDLNFKHLDIDVHLLQKVSKSIEHRGPDGEGVYTSGPVALIHRRLSIIDISESANQPMHSADGRYIIVFNGEIYNYKAFYPELKAAGYHFSTNADTEVLLYLWIEYGENMLHRLNGMWAFAIWDNLEKELVLCRDRLGVKPLYYAKEHGKLIFASEPKAIFAFGIENLLDENSIKEHFTFRYVDGERTIYQKIKKLLPGSLMSVKASSCQTTRWWNLKDRSNAFNKIQDPYTWFNETFHESINYRMVSDVPVGLLLSGGLDSSSVGRALFDNGFRDIHTFTIKFRQSEFNEGPLAARLAHDLNFKSHQLLIEEEDLLGNTIKASIAADQPLVHQNDGHLVAISHLSKQYVKVLLSGEGADELMGGYIRYKAIRRVKYLQRIRSLLSVLPIRNYRLNKLKKYLFTSDIETLLMWNGNNFFPDDLKKLGIDFTEKTAYRTSVLNESMELEHHDSVKKLLYLEQHTYLQTLLDRNDTTTMMSGIECREPFLDYRIVEGLMSLPSDFFIKGKKGKHILENSIGRDLPDYIRNFKKVGLSVPWNDYLRSDSRLQEYLNKNEYFEHVFGLDITSLVRSYLKGDDQHSMLIRYLFFFNIWYKHAQLSIS